MKAYFVQHAEALSKEENPERPLSEKGRSDIAKVASFVSKHQKIFAGPIVHSGKTRAQQTAEILASFVNPKRGVKCEDGLVPLADPLIWANRLNSSEEDICLVGHLPHLNKLISLLLYMDETKEIIKFQMGGIVCLEKVENLWSIIWMIVPDLVS